jgi:formate hydrogenlyase subunit 6/NADH:ubiquinone oxidoreductase subunit I
LARGRLTSSPFRSAQNVRGSGVYGSQEFIRRELDDPEAQVLCIGCKMCVQACPFDAMGWNLERGRVLQVRPVPRRAPVRAFL